VEISEVSEILGLFRGLRVPRHVFITSEAVHERVNGHVYYRGLQPVRRPDTIFLSRDADESSPIHEAVHAQTGLGELGTEVISGILVAKYRFLRDRPLIRGLVQRPLGYVRCRGCEEFREAHSSFQERVEHYVKA